MESMAEIIYACGKRMNISLSVMLWHQADIEAYLHPGTSAVFICNHSQFK